MKINISFNTVFLIKCNKLSRIFSLFFCIYSKTNVNLSVSIYMEVSIISNYPIYRRTARESARRSILTPFSSILSPSWLWRFSIPQVEWTLLWSKFDTVQVTKRKYHEHVRKWLPTLLWPMKNVYGFVEDNM